MAGVRRMITIEKFFDLAEICIRVLLMPGHSKATIISMAVVTVVVTSLLHEGLGHGVTAWLRGDVVRELTSNHLDTVHRDRLVDAGGTVVNLVAGAICLFASAFARRVNTRYFLAFLGSVNLLLGAGYFLFSGVLGLGDWADLIRGFPHAAPWRIGMALLGAAFYVFFVRLIAITLHPFVPRRSDYNTVARLPYLAACAFWCLAGAFDPLGFRLMLLSTIPASFGGMSGLLWADMLMPRAKPEEELVVERSPLWWTLAIVLGCAFLLTVARGIEFHQPQT
jgi:hypothetical protein